jgi:hypothetical protein
MPLDRTDVENALEQKGFTVTGGDHKFFTYHTVQGKKTQIFTKTSRGTKYKKLGDDLVKSMSNQCRLTMPLFKQLVACTMGRAEYQQYLETGGYITIEEDES